MVVQSLSHVPVFVTLWTAAHEASLSFTISHSLLKLMSIESAMHIPHTRLAKEAQQGSSSPALIFPESGSFPMSQLFSSGGQGIGASASASVLPVNIQG